MNNQIIKQELELNGFTYDVLSEYNMEVIDAHQLRKVLRLQTTTGDFVLKKFKLSQKELLYSFAAMSHVKQKGFPVPEVIPNRSGELFVQSNNSHSFMMELLEGREIQYSDKNDLSRTVQSLAIFHEATRGFQPPYCPGKTQWGTWKGHFIERIKEMQIWKAASEKQETIFDQMYAKHVDFAIKEALFAVRLLSNSRYQEISLYEKKLNGFCHHDLANHNILISDSQQIALIDFDYAISDIRTHDIASLILRNMKDSCWDLEKALFILKTYYGATPPHDGEERLIHAMIRFPQDFYELARFYYVEKRNNIQKLETRLIGWLKQQENRKSFLQKFETSAAKLLKAL
ncbi:CotS family spore coat protein [Bacillus sp. V5-8f]|uniref:CotS family spore coat protein n=1 Tax=Bacillus sp. V5-8f TaxID=2053044 RepID=UPI000C782F12|nr:CotS family spore coat protein [Bacillus sp. V5-8f]PLT35489.1 hypothetical protein CUU64_02450 [Bacillus sp. V5-8f]